MKAQKDFGVEVKELEGTTADEWGGKPAGSL